MTEPPRSPAVDIAIIGGGIHGVGIAQAAAASGYSVLLLEKAHLAAGTSSQSSKLIHGGLRYLDQGNIGLVRESLRERRILLRNAPHLVHLNRFWIPAYKGGAYPTWKIRLGLVAYAVLSGSNPLPALHGRSGRQFPILLQEKLRAVFGFRDAQTDDGQLTRAVAASARALGATILTGTRMVLARLKDDGYEISAQRAGELKRVTCRALINAAGPWVNEVAEHIHPDPEQIPVELVKGSHLIIESQVSPECFYLASIDDKRWIFVLPWQGKTLLGTTEVIFRGHPDKVTVSGEEVDYLIRQFNHYFPSLANPVICDTLSGLRVLPVAATSPFNRRRDVHFVSQKTGSAAYIAVYGGKLTGYRATAEKVITELKPVLGARARKANTAKLPLPELSDP